MEAVEYQGSSVAFIQLIAAMDRDGEIEREIRGKRTYRITGVGQPSVAPQHGGPAVGTPVAAIDYDLLAKAVVRELASQLATASVSIDQARLIGERNDYARQLQQAREQLDALLGAAAAPDMVLDKS